MIQSNVLYSLYRQSDSLESFKRKVLANRYDYRNGFPLFEIIRMFVNDEVDGIDGKDSIIEFLSSSFETGYDNRLVRQSMERQIYRLLESYYAQYLYDDHDDYQQAYRDDIDASIAA